MRLPAILLTAISLPQTSFAECATPQDTFLSCSFSQGRKAAFFYCIVDTSLLRSTAYYLGAFYLISVLALGFTCEFTLAS